MATRKASANATLIHAQTGSAAPLVHASTGPAAQLVTASVGGGGAVAHANAPLVGGVAPKGRRATTLSDPVVVGNLPQPSKLKGEAVADTNENGEIFLGDEKVSDKEIADIVKRGNSGASLDPRKSAIYRRWKKNQETLEAQHNDDIKRKKDADEWDRQQAALRQFEQEKYDRNRKDAASDLETQWQHDSEVRAEQEQAWQSHNKTEVEQEAERHARNRSEQEADTKAQNEREDNYRAEQEKRWRMENGIPLDATPEEMARYNQLGGKGKAEFRYSEKDQAEVDKINADYEAAVKDGSLSESDKADAQKKRDDAIAAFRKKPALRNDLPNVQTVDGQKFLQTQYGWTPLAPQKDVEGERENKATDDYKKGLQKYILDAKKAYDAMDPEDKAEQGEFNPQVLKQQYDYAYQASHGSVPDISPKPAQQTPAPTPPPTTGSAAAGTPAPNAPAAPRPEIKGCKDWKSI